MASCPRLRVLHTAALKRGQIYVPIVNWTLATATLGAVIGFGSSDNLAGAYGIGVSLSHGYHDSFGGPGGHAVGFQFTVNGAFLLIDLGFFAANSMKLFEGGWFPLVIAASIAFVMLTWRRGAEDFR